MWEASADPFRKEVIGVKSPFPWTMSQDIGRGLLPITYGNDEAWIQV
jgi:hypothetical protein